MPDTLLHARDTKQGNQNLPTVKISAFLPKAGSLWGRWDSDSYSQGPGEGPQCSSMKRSYLSSHFDEGKTPGLQ